MKKKNMHQRVNLESYLTSLLNLMHDLLLIPPKLPADRQYGLFAAAVLVERRWTPAEMHRGFNSIQERIEVIQAIRGVSIAIQIVPTQRRRRALTRGFVAVTVVGECEDLSDLCTRDWFAVDNIALWLRELTIRKK